MELKDILQQSLINAYGKLEKQVPQTKTATCSSDYISGVKPKELLQFMEDNDIPDNAYFDCDDNGNDIFLSWEIDIPTTEKDKLIFRRKRFTDIVWCIIYKCMLENGYKLNNIYRSSDYKQFDDTTIYDMFISKDFERLEKYYSYKFVKK